MNKEKIKNYIKKPLVRWLITGVLILAALASGISYFTNNGQENAPASANAKEVKALVLELNGSNSSTVEAVGEVEPKTKINVVSLAKGTVRSLPFAVGDAARRNELLASLSNQQTSISFLSAQTNYSSQKSNLAATTLITDENIRQAEIRVQAAEDAEKTAQVGLNAARENLDNAEALTDKSNLDIKNNSVISFNTYKNAVDNAVDQANFLLGIEEDEEQLANISTLLGVEDISSLAESRLSYVNARDSFSNISALTVNTDNITPAMSQAVEALSLTKEMLDDILTVLDNTITSADFTSADLSAQKTSFLGLRTSIIGSLSAAQANFQTLSNLGLLKNQQIDALKNALEAAQKQYVSAKTNTESALASLNAVKKSNELQLIASRAGLDNARAQLNLAGSQASDLRVKAPIAGKITGKFVEIGTEVSPGQKIAEISQLDLVTITLQITAEDALKLAPGQDAIIDPAEKKLRGAISRVFPSADPVSKKIKVEIAYNNENQDLIAGSFVNVSLPIENKAAGGAFYIPLNALTISPNESFVYTVLDGKAKKTVVTTGQIEGTEVEIKSGLSDGDILIIEGAKNLEPEEDVKVISLAK